MDSLTTFDPSETSGFITINAIRLKKVSFPRAFFFLAELDLRLGWGVEWVLTLL